LTNVPAEHLPEQAHRFRAGAGPELDAFLGLDVLRLLVGDPRIEAFRARRDGGSSGEDLEARVLEVRRFFEALPLRRVRVDGPLVGLEVEGVDRRLLLLAAQRARPVVADAGLRALDALRLRQRRRRNDDLLLDAPLEIGERAGQSAGADPRVVGPPHVVEDALVARVFLDEDLAHDVLLRDDFRAAGLLQHELL
jgi:hypothetical protein